jgi:hypothetical protein
MGCLQAVDPFGRRREGDPVPDKTCPDAEGYREVALACSRWAQKHCVGASLDEVESAEMGDDVLSDAALVIEVKVLQGLSRRETGRGDAVLTAVGLAGGHLSL